MYLEVVDAVCNLSLLIGRDGDDEVHPIPVGGIEVRDRRVSLRVVRVRGSPRDGESSIVLSDLWRDCG